MFLVSVCVVIYLLLLLAVWFQVSGCYSLEWVFWFRLCGSFHGACCFLSLARCFGFRFPVV